MLNKFLEWHLHLKVADKIKKPSRISSIAKALQWGVDNAPLLTSAEKHQIEQTLVKILPLKALCKSDIEEIVMAYNCVHKAIFDNVDPNAYLFNARKASQHLINAAGVSGKLLVIDFEMVCDNESEVDGEIIEFGICVFDTNSLLNVEVYSSLTLPKKVNELSEFCTMLTGITNNEMFSSAIEFNEAAKALEDLIINHNIVTVCQWGCGDMKRLKIDFANNNLPTEVIDRLKIINLKKTFSDSFGVSQRVGLKKALMVAGLQAGGTAHRALPDAINTSKLVKAIISRGDFSPM